MAIRLHQPDRRPEPPMTSQFQVREQLPAHWPAADVLSSPNWLRLMDGRPPGRRYYFRLAEGDRTVVGLLGYVVDDPQCYAPFNPFDLIWGDPPVFPDQIRKAGNAPEREMLFPCLIVVQPGYAASPAGEQAKETAEVRRLAEHIVEWARSLRLMLVATLYVGSAALTAAFAAAGTGWRRAPGTVRSTLALSGCVSFDGYLASLPKSGAKQVRSDLRRLAGLGVQIAQADPATLSDAEVALRWNVTQRYGGYSDIAAERQRLTDLLRIYPADQLRLFRCHHGSDLIAYSLFITHGREWTSFWYGCDYSHPSTDRSYFGSVFYAPIRAALAESVLAIDYGLGYEEGKARRGCHLGRRDIWLLALESSLGPWIDGAT
jgi:hypothetical protein